MWCLMAGITCALISGAPQAEWYVRRLGVVRLGQERTLAALARAPGGALTGRWTGSKQPSLAGWMTPIICCAVITPENPHPVR